MRFSVEFEQEEFEKLLKVLFAPIVALSLEKFVSKTEQREKQ